MSGKVAKVKQKPKAKAKKVAGKNRKTEPAARRVRPLSEIIYQDDCDEGLARPKVLFLKKNASINEFRAFAQRRGTR